MRSLFTVLAAIVGGLFTYFALRHRQAATATIFVRRQGGKCMTSTSPYRLHVEKGQTVVWEIDDQQNCLGDDANVELRFENDDSATETRRPKDKKAKGKRRIDDKVKEQPSKEHYKYTTFYTSPTEEYEMEDPEMQIEH